MRIYYSIIFLIIGYSCSHGRASEPVSNIFVKDTIAKLEAQNTSIDNQVVPDTSISKELKSFVLNDTTFLLRKDYGECGTHSVYIERNRKSKYYKLLKDFSINEYKLDTYNHYISMLNSKIKGGLKTFDLDSLPQQWLPLYLFEDKYYLYAPSDWGCSGKMAINSQSIICYNMDGPTPCAIRWINKVKNCYYINYVAPYGKENLLDEPTLAIYIVDPKYKIAIWEEKDIEGKFDYKLMIPTKYANYFDIINNYSPQCKALEIELEQPDYKSLLYKFKKENNKY